MNCVLYYTEALRRIVLRRHNLFFFKLIKYRHHYYLVRNVMSSDYHKRKLN